MGVSRLIDIGQVFWQLWVCSFPEYKLFGLMRLEYPQSAFSNIAQSSNAIGGFCNFLSSNSLKVKNAVSEYLTREY
jgi:hypothetical protein